METVKPNVTDQFIRLQCLEAKIAAKMATDTDIDYCDVARTIYQIKSTKLYKVPTDENNKIMYRTFDSYLTHFNFEASQLELLKKMLRVVEIFESSHLPESKYLFPISTYFWTLLCTVKSSKLIDTVKLLYSTALAKSRFIYEVDDLQLILKMNPDWQTGYSVFKVKPVQSILINSEKLTDSDIEEYAEYYTSNKPSAAQLKAFTMLHRLVLAMMIHTPASNFSLFLVDTSTLKSNDVFGLKDDGTVLVSKKVPVITLRFIIRLIVVCLLMWIMAFAFGFYFNKLLALI